MALRGSAVCFDDVSGSGSLLTTPLRPPTGVEPLSVSSVRSVRTPQAPVAKTDCYVRLTTGPMYVGSVASPSRSPAYSNVPQPGSEPLSTPLSRDRVWHEEMPQSVLPAPQNVHAGFKMVKKYTAPPQRHAPNAVYKPLPPLPPLEKRPVRFGPVYEGLPPPPERRVEEVPQSTPVERSLMEEGLDDDI